MGESAAVIVERAKGLRDGAAFLRRRADQMHDRVAAAVLERHAASLIRQAGAMEMLLMPQGVQNLAAGLSKAWAGGWRPDRW